MGKLTGKEVVRVEFEFLQSGKAGLVWFLVSGLSVGAVLAYLFVHEWRMLRTSRRTPPPQHEALQIKLPAGGSLQLKPLESERPYELVYLPGARIIDYGDGALVTTGARARVTSLERSDMPIGRPIDATVLRDWWLREFPHAR